MPGVNDIPKSKDNEKQQKINVRNKENRADLLPTSYEEVNVGQFLHGWGQHWKSEKCGLRERYAETTWGQK